MSWDGDEYLQSVLSEAERVSSNGGAHQERKAHHRERKAHGQHAQGDAADEPRPPLRSYFAEELEQHPVEAVDWVVEPLIPSGAVTGLFGDGGTGKDLLLFMLATAATCGQQWLGRDVKQGRVLYFPIEDDDKELRRRQAAIVASPTFQRGSRSCRSPAKIRCSQCSIQKAGLSSRHRCTPKSSAWLRNSSLRWSSSATE
jgi:hypothetical protein